MIVVIGLLLAAFVISNAVLLQELRSQRRDSWAREQNLLNRVQAPEVFQPAYTDSEEIEVEPQIADEWDMVGTVKDNGG